MKFLERILILAILALVGAFIFVGGRGHPEYCTADLEVAAVGARIIPAYEVYCETPPQNIYKTPADDMKDPMAELVFDAKDELTMRKSLADFKLYLSAEKFEELEAFLKAKHCIPSNQNESGTIELRYPSLIVLKAYDGKSPKDILSATE